LNPGFRRDPLARDPGSPCLQRARQRFLHDILSQTEVFDAEYSRQRRHHLSRLMTKKMLH
jgi:hypothetical protein